MSFVTERRESTLDRAKQSFKDESDINNITRRFAATGMVSHLAKGIPSFADVSDAGDLRTLLDRVRAASEWFSHLSPRVREYFGNDPAAFVDAANSPDRDAILREAGIVETAPERAPLSEVPQARNPDGTFAVDRNRDGRPD